MTDDQPRPDIIVPAVFNYALHMLDRDDTAAKELTAAITAINEHGVDLDDDAIDAIEHERLIRRVSADAIAKALAVRCQSTKHLGMHALNTTELHNRQCICGAKIVIEEVKQ